MTLTPEKLDEIERLAELATPGPWYYAGCNTVHDADHDEVAHPCDMTHDCATARYIAACDPDTIRELVRAARIGLTSSGESGVKRGGRAIQWPDGINTAEMPEDGAV